nr:hypothetical protein CFP56_55254 [Quercus suber]
MSILFMELSVSWGSVMGQVQGQSNEEDEDKLKYEPVVVPAADHGSRVFKPSPEYIRRRRRSLSAVVPRAWTMSFAYPKISSTRISRGRARLWYVPTDKPKPKPRLLARQ